MKLWAEYGRVSRAVVDEEILTQTVLEKIQAHVAEAHARPPRSASA
jgi:hypothetical protein